MKQILINYMYIYIYIFSIVLILIFIKVSLDSIYLGVFKLLLYVYCTKNEIKNNFTSC